MTWCGEARRTRILKLAAFVLITVGLFADPAACYVNTYVIISMFIYINKYLPVNPQRVTWCGEARRAGGWSWRPSC